MLLKIKTYRKEEGVFSISLVEDGEKWITDKFCSINVWGKFKGKTYYNIFTAPGNTIIDEDDFKRIYEAMNK